MTSKIGHHSRISGRRWRAVSGALAVGTVFLSAANAARSQEAPGYTVLYAFTGGADRNESLGDLIRDKAGNLYGTTLMGGDLSACSGGCGAVFKLDPTGKETVLYSFTGGADGGFPFAGLVRDKEGNLYAATTSGAGTVFKLDPTDKQTVLYTFTGGVDGAGPLAALVRDKEGNLYGTTVGGGDLSGCLGSGCGVVFKLDPTDKETVLYGFSGGADGSRPNYAGYAGLVRDKEGNLYGTTFEGGDLSCALGGGLGCGVVFKVDPTGKETVLYTFTGGADGGLPNGGLVRDKDDNLYGTTEGGGDLSAGVVFKLDPTGKETVLYSFTGGADGSFPEAGLVRDKEGNLYGTTFEGGDLSCAQFPGSGCGVVFKLGPTGKETVLYSFTGGADGGSPFAGLVRDKEGNLYGTTASGGDTSCPFGFLASGCGVVFKITP